MTDWEKIKNIFLDKTIAVVGSSPNLKKNGQKIEEHDIIIRFNLAYPVKGKEEYLGKRTDVLVCNCHVSNGFLRENLTRYIQKQFIDEEYSKNVLNYYKDQNPTFILRASNKNIETAKNIHYIPKSGIDFCNKVIKKLSRKYPNLKGLKLKVEPRMGLHTVLFLIQFGFKPSIFGMDIKNPSNDKYYSNVKISKKECHDVKNEGTILRALVKNGLVVPY